MSQRCLWTKLAVKKSQDSAANRNASGYLIAPQNVPRQAHSVTSRLNDIISLHIVPCRLALTKYLAAKKCTFKYLISLVSGGEHMFIAQLLLNILNTRVFWSRARFCLSKLNFPTPY
jgi:hypothetical protein